MKDIELIGPRVRVRRARPADANASFEWFANRAVTEYLPLAGESSLWLVVRADNHRGLRLFTRLGFLVVETFEALVGISATPRHKHHMELSATR